MRGVGEDADTQVRGRAGAHPRADSGGQATKNRRKSMWIIPQGTDTFFNRGGGSVLTAIREEDQPLCDLYRHRSSVA
jgi:hypothetical protein